MINFQFHLWFLGIIVDRIYGNIGRIAMNTYIEEIKNIVENNKF